MIREWGTQQILNTLKPLEGPFSLKSKEGKKILRECRKKTISLIITFLYARLRNLARLKSSKMVRNLYESFYDVTTEEFFRRYTDFDQNLVYYRFNGEVIFGCHPLRPRVCERIIIGDIIEELNPSSVCEVGSGAGETIFYLANRFPRIEFTGYELTQSGVKLCKTLQVHGLFNSPYGELFNFSPESDEKIRRINFHCASAYDINCKNKSYDLVYTFAALEQMADGLPEALSEIRRIGKRYVVFREPFLEANDFYGKMYLKIGDYFRYSVDDIEKYGFRPIAFFNNLPMKFSYGFGILVAELGYHA